MASPPAAEAATSGNPGADQRSGTARESRKSAASPKTRAAANLQVTGANAVFPVLGMTYSHEAASNTKAVLNERLTVWQWKKMVQLVKAKALFEEIGRPWKRPARWLAGMYATEMAAVWGHLGGAVRELRGPRGPPLMK